MSSYLGRACVRHAGADMNTTAWLEVILCSVANCFFGSCQRQNKFLATECSSCRAVRGEGMAGALPLPLGGGVWGVSPEKILVELTQNRAILHTFQAILSFL